MPTHNPQLVFPSFQPWNWEDKDKYGVKSLIETEALTATDIPLTGLGIDNPDNFRFYTAEEVAPVFDLLYERAIANVRMIRVQNTLIDRWYPLILVAGSYFACEKILDTQYMCNLHQKLNTDLLAVGIPRKGEMLVTDAGKASAVKRFRHLIELKYEEENKRPALSKSIFLVKDGVVKGVILEDEVLRPAANKKKGFFSKLFG